MEYTNPKIADAAKLLAEQLQRLSNKSDIFKADEYKALLSEIKTMPITQRAKYGAELNDLRKQLQEAVQDTRVASMQLSPIDVSAPFDLNTPSDRTPRLFNSRYGSVHPLMTELAAVLDIFYRMGFNAVESREIDDDFHMFETLNFAEGHPARDDYDTFLTNQTDNNGKAFIAPAHTSTMQHRVLTEHKYQLESGKPIAVVIPGRVFRNEDLDARHEHTFYQLEGVYVDHGVSVGQLIATLQTFLQSYYSKQLKVKTQPSYFPFTEPSFEFALSCPFCDQAGCHICSRTGWIELLGCGMIHPNVLHKAGIDTNKYTGFAWGSGIERLVMMKYGIEDIRLFGSGRLDFLRQFS